VRLRFQERSELKPVSRTYPGEFTNRDLITAKCEHGFEMNKSTAHGLIKKSAWMMGRLNKVLKKTVLEDDYL